MAKKSIQISQEKQKKNYDIRARGAVIQPGDKVLVKIVAFDGPHKLSDKWEEDPYIVISQPNRDIPVYIVKKENNTSKSRTLHRNLLLPIGHVDLPVKKPKPTPRKSKVTRKSQMNASQHEDSDSDTNSDEIMVHEAASIAQSNDSTPASRMENSLANEEDSNEEDNNEEDNNEKDSNEEDSAEDEGDTGTPLLEDYAHDSSASAARERDTARTTATADIQENTQLKEVDTSANGDDTEDDAEDDDEEDDDEDEDLDDTNSRENSASKQQAVPLPRRSQRVKKTTSWITSGDYIVNQQVVTKQPDWKTRADYLQTLVSSDVFHSKNSKELIEKTLLQIISGRH